MNTKNENYVIEWKATEKSTQLIDKKDTFWNREDKILTRPYTRAEVACGWAGAAKKLSEAKCHRPTDRQTDRRTEWFVESRARD